ERLLANANKSFVGSYVLGMGFTFDDTDTKGIASPIAEMHRLIAKDPRNAERIFPYIGGEEVNTSPTHAHHRYVINFGEMSEQEARGWPDLITIIENKVRGTRGSHSTAPWWQFERLRPEMYSSFSRVERVLVVPQTSNVQALAFLAKNMVFAHTAIVFPIARYSGFAVLQSRCHQIWSAFLGPTMKDDLRYTPSDCFETFPFPRQFETDLRLEATGALYYEFRLQLMLENDEGLTKTYNRFHD